jgi:pilus assembly protein Flp/PilA
MLQYIANIQTRLAEDDGATAVEYGLLVALIAAVIVATVVTLGQDVLVGFQKVESRLPAA